MRVSGADADCTPQHWSAYLGSPSGALLSGHGKYRTLLWRTFGIGGDAAPLVFVMLNPSTADMHKDDNTIRRCLSFAHREGAGGILVVNLCAFRTKSPQLLKDAKRRSEDVVFAGENDPQIKLAIARGSVVMGWGDNARGPVWLAQRRACVCGMVLANGRHPLCLGRTKHGEPRHPLFVRMDAPLERLP